MTSRNKREGCYAGKINRRHVRVPCATCPVWVKPSMRYLRFVYRIRNEKAIDTCVLY